MTCYQGVLDNKKPLPDKLGKRLYTWMHTKGAKGASNVVILTVSHTTTQRLSLHLHVQRGWS